MMFLFWIGFLFFIGVLLAFDLGIFHRKDLEPSSLDALRMTLIWIAVALAFSGFIFGAYEHHWFGIGQDALGIAQTDGRTAMLNFITGYLVEYSLSLDNIFVIALVFAYFKIPGKFQHRVLFWGILGAIVMRAIMILAGIELIHTFAWTLYFFGAFLLFTSLKMLGKQDEDIHPDQGLLVRLLHKMVPVSTKLDGNRMLTRLPDGRRAVTLLLVTLVVVENTDVLFAVDSIPAVFAVTTDPFLVFTSNIFAILGLRSLYFALNAMLNRFYLLKFSIVSILAFIGTKMLLAKWILISSGISLLVIVVALALGIIASLLFPFKPTSK